MTKENLHGIGANSAAALTVIDNERAESRRLVTDLYAMARGLRRAGRLADARLSEEAAALLDSYQAGLILTTPHPLTGYTIERAAQ